MRENRRTVVGKVASAKMQKTVVVTVHRLELHPKYKKYIRKRTKLYAHDERAECKEGDSVQLIETRPMSRLKRWRVVKKLMIQDFSRLVVTDNSGARLAMVIRVYGGSRRRFGWLGDTVMVTVKDALPNGTVKAGEKSKAIVVRCRKEHRRPDGTYVRFDDNACVLVDDKGEPKGTRVFGPVARELRERKYTKIVSLAAEVV